MFLLSIFLLIKYHRKYIYPKTELYFHSDITALGTDQFCKFWFSLMLGDGGGGGGGGGGGECNNVKPISRIPSQRLTDTSNKYIDNNGSSSHWLFPILSQPNIELQLQLIKYQIDLNIWPSNFEIFALSPNFPLEAKCQ